MKSALALFLAASLCGCTTNEYSRKRGEDSVTFKRTSFGLTQAIGEISVTTNADGVQSLKVSAYASKDSDIVAAAVGAAVSAATKGKP